MIVLFAFATLPVLAFFPNWQLLLALGFAIGAFSFWRSNTFDGDVGALFGGPTAILMSAIYVGIGYVVMEIGEKVRDYRRRASERRRHFLLIAAHPGEG